MACFVSYESSTGQIIAVESGVFINNEEAYKVFCVQNGGNGLEALISEVNGVNPKTHWINGGSVEDKTEFSLVVTGSIISNVPVNTVTTWPDEVKTVETDGVVELMTNALGVYSFTFQHPEYFTTVVEVNYNV